MLNMNPHYHYPPPRAIPAIVVRAHYTLWRLVIVVVVHQRCYRPPPPPSSPSRGWLLLGAAFGHRHPHHCRPPPTQPHQRRRPRRLASSSSPPAIPTPPLPSRPLRPLDRPWRCHGPACCGVDALPPSPTWQVPLPHAPPSSGYGPIAPAPRSRPPQCRSPLRQPAVDPPSPFASRALPSARGGGDGSTATLMVVPGNPAPRRRHRDDYLDMLRGRVMFCSMLQSRYVRILCVC